MQTGKSGSLFVWLLLIFNDSVQFFLKKSLTVASFYPPQSSFSSLIPLIVSLHTSCIISNSLLWWGWQIFTQCYRYISPMHSGTWIYLSVIFHFIPLIFLVFPCNCVLAKVSSRALQMFWSLETTRKLRLKKLCSKLRRIQIILLLETKESLKTPDHWPDMFSLMMNITRYFGQGLLKPREKKVKGTISVTSMGSEPEIQTQWTLLNKYH